MSKRIFTTEQIKELRKNPAIARCSERSITYDENFKIRAVKLYEQGLTSTEIFRQSGLGILGKDKAVDCLRRWKRVVRKKGKAGLREARGKGGGRPKKMGYQSDADRIKRMEAEIAYLKAENDFLAKLRANRAE